MSTMNEQKEAALQEACLLLEKHFPAFLVVTEYATVNPDKSLSATASVRHSGTTTIGAGLAFRAKCFFQNIEPLGKTGFQVPVNNP